jgi:CheY-like chemotaxis protein
MEATKQLRDSGYDRTIVALTANAIVGQADIFLQNGFDDFISKPIDIHQLDAVLNKYIHDKSEQPDIILMEEDIQEMSGDDVAGRE